VTFPSTLPERLLGLATLAVVAWDRTWLAVALFLAAWAGGAWLEYEHARKPGAR
jgi:hypothetical protein